MERLTEEKAKALIAAHNKESFAVVSGNSLLVRRLIKRGFSSVAIAEIIEIVEDICHHCYNDDAGCQCTNCN